MFLVAQWRELAVANFEIDPAVLAPHVPCGTELECWNGAALVSLVGFQFRDTRVLGLWLPGHRNFPEVNLRFYVRRRVDNGWRRAVVFIKELAPRRLVAWTARRCFGENYVTVPMQCRVHDDHERRAVEYHWRHQGRAYRLAVTGQGPRHLAADGSEEEFVIEHYWAYTRLGAGRTMQYRVDHPRWWLRTAAGASFEGDAAAIYGDAFAEALYAPPASAFLAEGSEVSVMRGSRLKLDGDLRSKVIAEKRVESVGIM